ncbi:hypothetical protein G7046_g1294 [Stylonectria norvegica]|nr:hypothetical protein G7046_g1294 [Stylonectria norvegica]
MAASVEFLNGIAWLSNTFDLMSSNVELEPQATRTQQAQESQDSSEEAGINSQQLKPVDGGRDAWTVLIAGFVFESIFWGFPSCFGVFQNYYSNLPEFKDDISNISLIGTLAQGFVYLAAPLSAMATKRFPKYQRQQIWLGWPLCVLGLLTASFTNSVSGLIATQGFLYGFGFVTLTYPIISMINEWWVARKGMAFGVISAASGATGAVMPFIIDALLHKYGHKTTLRASAVAMVFLTGPLIPLFRGRLPVSDQAALPRTDWSFLRRPVFWVYASAILMQGLGFFFPLVFLPSYASSVGLSSFDGALLLALMAIAQVLGQFAFGYLSDKHLSVNTLSTAACVAAAAATLALWGLGKSMTLLVLFSIIYGFFGFGFGTLRVAMGREVSNDPSTVYATYAMFVFVQGIGNILITPISTSLMASKPILREQYGAGKYDGIIILTGVEAQNLRKGRRRLTQPFVIGTNYLIFKDKFSPRCKYYLSLSTYGIRDHRKCTAVTESDYANRPPRIPVQQSGEARFPGETNHEQSLDT